MRQLVSRFLNDESGATAIEYCLIAVGLILRHHFHCRRHRTPTGNPLLNTKFTSVNSSLK